MSTTRRLRRLARRPRRRVVALRTTTRTRFRLATARFRALPDVVIIGAQKCGTSSLLAYLAQHPKVVPSSTKEVHFFSGGLDPSVDNYALGERWYRSHFPIRRQLSDAHRVLEATPLYLFNPLVPKRMHAMVPGAKLIVLLRNPTDRLVSHFGHEVKAGWIDTTVEQALADEDELFPRAVDRGDFKHPDFIHRSLKSRGHYAEQLERFFVHYPREQVLALGSESFFEDPDSTLAEVFDFIGVAATSIADLAARNVRRRSMAVPDSVYAELDEYFRPHNEHLYSLLGIDLGWSPAPDRARPQAT